MMLGIPTRSDACQIDESYARAVALEKAQEELWRLREMLFSTFTHNHVIEAYRDAGFRDHIARLDGITSIPVDSVPRAVSKRLRPRLVRDRYLADIERYQATLEQAKDHFDQMFEVTMQKVYGPPSDRLYPEIAQTLRYTDSVWIVSFNPYDLAQRVLGLFRGMIEHAYNASHTPLARIIEMYRVGTRLDKDPNVEMLVRALYMRIPPYPAAFEYGDGPVAEMYWRHRSIQENSHLVLGFEERSFMMQEGGNTSSTPSDCLLNLEDRMKHTSLGRRHILRRFAQSYSLKHKGIVINGGRYVRQLLPGIPSLSGWTVDGLTDQGIVNLLGEPVQQSNGEIIHPEQWAQDEFDWVFEYTINRDPKAKRALLKAYDLDATAGHPSRQKAINQLDYCLRINRAL